jgi:hypothetical protein
LAVGAIAAFAGRGDKGRNDDEFKIAFFHLRDGHDC